MVHELSHMWFGDSVAPYSWSDLWLNEGHASWYEFTYAAENGFLAEDTGLPGHRHATSTSYMRPSTGTATSAAPTTGRSPAPQRDPDTLFSINVYSAARSSLFALASRSECDVPADRARLGRRATATASAATARLHRARVAGRRPRPERLPARLALRHDARRRCRATRTGPPIRSRRRPRRRERSRRRDSGGADRHVTPRVADAGWHPPAAIAGGRGGGSDGRSVEAFDSGRGWRGRRCWQPSAAAVRRRRP